MNRNCSPPASGAVLLADRRAECVPQVLDRHPGVPTGELRPDAAPPETESREGQASPGFAQRPVPTEADVRMHDWFTQRLAAFRRERRGLGWKLRRLLSGLGRGAR